MAAGSLGPAAIFFHGLPTGVCYEPPAKQENAWTVGRSRQAAQ